MPPEQEVPPISGFTLRLFTRIVRRYFRRHFRSVMAQHAERLVHASGPLIVYANHSSWWDPMISILLAQTLLPGFKHYAPMDADALARYPILRKLGIFPVEMTTARGAAQFLRTGCAILREGGVLWVTPQGRFADPRAWPLAFKPGLAALALRVPEATIVPLAIEYTFWDERLPEALLYMAEPVTLTADVSTENATKQLETALGEAMLALQKASIARDPQAFQTLLQGGRGTGGFYTFGRKVRAMFGGKNIQEDHTLRDKS
jgi:1-acyl-sn-glycerol-3-phosphate acyltransferase